MSTCIFQYGSWNPYFTNCLLNEFDSEIRKGPVGCELLPVVEAFKVTPKFAGWKSKFKHIVMYYLAISQVSINSYSFVNIVTDCF